MAAALTGGGQEPLDQSCLQRRQAGAGRGGAPPLHDGLWRRLALASDSIDTPFHDHALLASLSLLELRRELWPQALPHPAPALFSPACKR